MYTNWYGCVAISIIAENGLCLKSACRKHRRLFARVLVRRTVDLVCELQVSIIYKQETNRTSICKHIAHLNTYNAHAPA